jgi:membrane protease YdiL (CAAX protease family)
LQARYGALAASLIFGLIHAIWHLPYLFFIPGQDLFGAPFPAYWIMTTANAIVLTWILNHARGSVLIATLYHASFNATGFLYVGIGAGLSVAEYWWMRAGAYGGAAIIVLLGAGLSLSRPTSTAHTDGKAVTTGQPVASK